MVKKQQNGRPGIWLALIVLGLLASRAAQGMEVAPEERAAVHAWVAARFEGQTAEPPFSFVYGGKPSERLSVLWNIVSTVPYVAAHWLPATSPTISIRSPRFYWRLGKHRAVYPAVLIMLLTCLTARWRALLLCKP